MSLDDDLLFGAERTFHDLLEGLAVLGEGPVPLPSEGLRVFLAEQEAASLPVQREAPASAMALTHGGALTALRTEPDRRGPRGRGIAARLASLGLVSKVLLGSGAALAGVAGAGVAGALPPAFQHAWDVVEEASASLRGPADEESAAPDAPERPAIGPGSDTSPDAPLRPEPGADREAPTRQEETSRSGDDGVAPEAGSQAAPAADTPGEVTQFAPSTTWQGSDDAAAGPVAPSSPQAAYDQGATTDPGTAGGEAWAPVSDEPTSEPAASSPAPPRDDAAARPDQPTSTPSTPAPIPATGGDGTGPTPGPTGSGSGGW